MQRSSYKFYRGTVLLLFCAQFFYQSCSTNDEPRVVDCNTTDLEIELVSKTNPTSCTLENGSISVSASGGKSPYQFKLDAGTYATNSTFSNLGGGTFIITVIDQNGCERSLNVTLEVPSGLTATITGQTANSNCLAPYNGSVTIAASGGSGNYEYSIDGGAFGTTNTFSGLKDGLYAVTVKDLTDNCLINVSVRIDRIPTGVVYNGSGQIKELFQSKCGGGACHPANGELFVYSEAFNRRNDIKARTQSGDMPRGGITLTPDEKAKIACWVDDGAPQN